MKDPVYIPGYIDQLTEELRDLTSYEEQSARVYGMKMAGQLGECKIFVMNFKERYGTMYSKDRIKVIELKEKK